MTYAEKARAIAVAFENTERRLGRSYALGELRQALNALSNEALKEMQTIREETPW